MFRYRFLFCFLEFTSAKQSASFFIEKQQSNNNLWCWATTMLTYYVLFSLNLRLDRGKYQTKAWARRITIIRKTKMLFCLLLVLPNLRHNQSIYKHFSSVTRHEQLRVIFVYSLIQIFLQNKTIAVC